MSAPEVSVVVPTHNRGHRLEELLDALAAQTDAPPFEVVVVDDGSSDDTAERLAEPRDLPFELVVLRQPPSGPATARNLAMERARGDYLALLGDDTVPEPGWLALHRDAHRERGDPASLAVIGYTRWHERVRVTPFLDFINEHGPQFGFALIDDPEAVPFNFFYSSNVSLPRALVAEERFDPDFPYAAWEDSELGYRLWRRRDLRIVYEARAVVAHDHPTDLARFMRRQERAGEAAIVFQQRHPEMGPWLGIGEAGAPKAPPAALVSLIGRLAGLLQRVPGVPGNLWRSVLRLAYMRGLDRGWGDRPRGVGAW